MPYIVGLTGGIASGKTTIANLFQHQFNIGIVDADVMARDVVKLGSIGLQKITEYFGQTILEKNGELNRTALSARIFSNHNEKKWLNDLLHPMIHNKMEQELNKITTPYALLVVPLLIENQLQSMADRILVVDTSTETQIDRAMKRDNLPQNQIKSILASQVSREKRLKYADDIILNDKDYDALLPQVAVLHKKYMSLCTYLS